MAGKKSAKDSLAKLSRGLTRETPATRAAQQTAAQQQTAVAANEAGTANGGGNGGRGKRTSAKAAVAEGTRPTTSPAPTAEPPARRRGRPRTKPDRTVRVSVDLPRSDHKYLRDFAYDAESDGMSVMRALLQEMRGDDALAERVLDRLAEE